MQSWLALFIPVERGSYWQRLACPQTWGLRILMNSWARIFGFFSYFQRRSMSPFCVVFTTLLSWNALHILLFLTPGERPLPHKLLPSTAEYVWWEKNLWSSWRAGETIKSYLCYRQMQFAFISIKLQWNISELWGLYLNFSRGFILHIWLVRSCNILYFSVFFIYFFFNFVFLSLLSLANSLSYIFLL